MTVTNQHATIYRGDSETLDVDLTAADGGPFSLGPGGTIKYRVSQTSHDAEADATIRKELNDGISLDGATAVIDLTSLDTDVAPGIYYHEVKVIDGPDVATAMTGNLTIRPSLRMEQPLASRSSLGVAIGVRADATKVP